MHTHFCTRADVPEGWYHATENLDETIAVAGQSFVKGPVSKEMRLEVQVRAARNLQEAYEKLVKLESFYLNELHQTHRGIAGNAAIKLRDLGRHQDAYRRLDEAIALNPKHADSYTQKGQFMLLDALCDRLCIRVCPASLWNRDGSSTANSPIKLPRDSGTRWGGGSRSRSSSRSKR